MRRTTFCNQSESRILFRIDDTKQNPVPSRYTAIITFFRTWELKIASNKIPLIFTFIMKSNTQVRRNFEKLKMIHKQELHSLQPSGKLSADKN